MTTPPPADPVGKPRLNVVGLVSLLVAIAGIAFAVVPAVAPVGWVLIVVGLVLGIVAMSLRSRSRGLAIAGLAVSALGIVVAGVVIVVSLIGSAPTFPSPFPSASASREETPDATPSGSIDDPLPLGTPIELAGWTYTIDDLVTNPATVEAQMSESGNYFVPAEAGQRYVVMGYSITNDGDDPAYPMEVPTALVSPDDDDLSIDLPRYVIDDTDLLPPGDTRMLSVAFLIPDDSQPLLRVTQNIVADPVYVEP
ncbi:DUF4190 domain-containing protein [Herbiconiux sp. KACC 21604]|uniref:DUF4190 domain-containing protein n=1 Tax=unclassified Herbiconiux TaxID=2618217 RepID=UPI001491604A|nr:DUF4190 domain-containing protein [Herbiconiux sp. SALV-R1]QJU55276.1 hypothetical protein HL652_17745 [Herbiconiux sp. SALV-R1]WPO86443.1 DUF4190 domain-containing protein [Herbiconiux sp. KACC 21604]